MRAGAVTAELALASAVREDGGRIVAHLIGAFGWDLAEEAVQEAYAAALVAWRRDGVPAQPRAWLTTTARNRAIDRVRRSRVEEAKLRSLPVWESPPPSEFPDERLRLLFTCCHPALSLESQVTLALRTLCGLTVEEIARTFLVPAPTMAKRLVRTRKKIQVAGIPYRVPRADQLPARTAAVLATIYLLFHQGYADERADLRSHARHLATLVDSLMPDVPEAAGLLALLLLLDARSDARVRDGVLVPLDEQDHSLWDRPMITAGEAALRRALSRSRPGRYQLQALIAACHVQEVTDWPAVVRLYDRLLPLLPSDTVRLNRAIALSMRDGPDLGLLDALGDHPLLPATRADFHRRLGDHAAAVVAYRSALARATSAPERAFLQRRITELPSGE